jgi:hypothetical protein
MMRTLEMIRCNVLLLSILTASFEVESNLEEDEHRIEQRFKQIGYGKNTAAYDRYITAVPRASRQGYSIHPRTPDPHEKVSKRAFAGRIKVPVYCLPA